MGFVRMDILGSEDREIFYVTSYVAVEMMVLR